MMYSIDEKQERGREEGKGRRKKVREGRREEREGERKELKILFIYF